MWKLSLREGVISLTMTITIIISVLLTFNCLQGFELQRFVSKSECYDLKQCREFEECSHFCEDVQGCFRCGCKEGFSLSKSNRNEGHCILDDPTWILAYATVSKEIGYIFHDKDGKDYRHINISTQEPGKHAHKFYDVSLDVEGNILYWTAEIGRAGAIYRMSLGGSSEPEVVADSGILTPRGIAYDWVGGNIYYTDYALLSIVVCNTKARSLCSPLVSTKEDDVRPGAIALHPDQGLMFWAHGDKIVMRSGMDGSEPVAILSSDHLYLSGITIDLVTSRVFLVNRNQNSIESVKLDGSDHQVLFFSPSEWDSTETLTGIDVLGDRVFWSDRDEYYIKSADKLTGLHETVHLQENGTEFAGLAIGHSTKQPKVLLNPCSDAKCSDICIISPQSKYKCLCPPGMKLEMDGKTCKKIDHYCPPPLYKCKNGTCAHDPRDCESHNDNVGGGYGIFFYIMISLAFLLLIVNGIFVIIRLILRVRGGRRVRSEQTPLLSSRL